MKFLSNITPRFRADLAGLVLTPRSSIENIELFAPLSFIPNKEEFSFIWVQFQFIRRHASPNSPPLVWIRVALQLVSLHFTTALRHRKVDICFHAVKLAAPSLSEVARKGFSLMKGSKCRERIVPALKQFFILYSRPFII